MIDNPDRLRALIRKASNGDSGKSQLLYRNYAMERFLERLSLSRFKDNFILKGGIVISSLVGLDSRATQDIDATIRRIPMEEDKVKRAIQEISEVPIPDGMKFEVISCAEIMEDAKYSGIRISINAYMGKIRIPIKIDVSTGDAITPCEISHSFSLMFEERTISLWSYNIETVLSEKIHALLTLSTANTRMRDYFDIYIMQHIGIPIDNNVLSSAILATFNHWGDGKVLGHYEIIISDIQASHQMQELWQRYLKSSTYTYKIEWIDIMESVKTLCDHSIPSLIMQDFFSKTEENFAEKLAFAKITATSINEQGGTVKKEPDHSL